MAKFVWVRGRAGAQAIAGLGRMTRKQLEELAALARKAEADEWQTFLKTFGIQFKDWFLRYATEQLEEWGVPPEARSGYTWRRGVLWRLGPGKGPYAGHLVSYRQVSVNSPPASWWYPPKVWHRRKVVKRKTKQGVRVHVYESSHFSPPRDMKPALRAGKDSRAIPIPATKTVQGQIMFRSKAAYWFRLATKRNQRARPYLRQVLQEARLLHLAGDIGV